MTTTEAPAAPALSLAQIEALPVLSIILDAGLNPHAWQKRIIVTSGGARRQRWFCTSDSDWGDTSEQLLAEWDGFTLLWLPSAAVSEAALLSADQDG